MKTIDLEGRFYKLSPPGRFDGLQPIPLTVDLSTAALLVVDVYGLAFTPSEGTARHHPSVDDADTTAVGDDEANTLLTRQYRAPWQHPEPAAV